MVLFFTPASQGETPASLLNLDFVQHRIAAFFFAVLLNLIGFEGQLASSPRLNLGN
jgi:hypothetical protein